MSDIKTVPNAFPQRESQIIEWTPSLLEERGYMVEAPCGWLASGGSRRRASEQLKRMRLLTSAG